MSSTKARNVDTHVPGESQLVTDTAESPILALPTTSEPHEIHNIIHLYPETLYVNLQAIVND